MGRGARGGANHADGIRDQRWGDPALPRPRLRGVGARDAQRPGAVVTTTFVDVRRLALGLPETEERLTWETDITFRVRDKIFAIGGEGADRVSIKAGLETQAELIEMDPQTFAK